jgi:hypothetical protein
MSDTPDIQRDAWRRSDLATLAGVCALAGVLTALAVWFSPIVTVAACVFLLGLGAVEFMLGVGGTIIVGMMFICFLFMNRFDEGWAIPVGEVSIKASYWLMLASVAVFAGYAFGVRLRERSATRDTGRFSRTFLWLWAGFVLVGLLAIPINHWTDSYVPDRYLAGELLALGAVVLPITFALWIPLSNLSRPRTLWSLRALVGLGGLAGFIMMVFGVMPDYVLGRLGWMEAIGGTTDLVRGRLPLGHPNIVASVMLLLLPLSVIQALGGSRIWLRLFYGACAFSMFCGVLFTLSRAAVLNMGIAFSITMAYMLFARENRRAWSLLLLAGFVTALVLAGGYLFARHDFSRFWSRGYHEDASVGRRAASMSTALYVWKDHPLVGVSPDAVYTRLSLRPGWTPAMEDSISPILFYRGHQTAETPHNSYLTTLAEFGVLGALCFWGLLLRAGRSLWRARGHPGIGVYERKMLTGMGIGLLTFLAAGMFEAVMMVGLRANIVFWIMVGLSLRYAFVVVEEAERRESGRAGAGPDLC